MHIILHEVLILLYERELRKESMLEKDVVKYFKDKGFHGIRNSIKLLFDLGSISGTFERGEDNHFFTKLVISPVMYSFIESMRRDGDYQKILEKHKYV